MRMAGEAEGVALSAVASQAGLGRDSASALRAMRFAIEGCLKEGGLDQPELSFADSLQRTLADADRFRSIVREATGAASNERALQAAFTAGMVRRGFLKGVGLGRGCKYPARPRPAAKPGK
jgi:hypothetical protein